MQKREMVQECTTVNAKANKAVYLPFANGEMVLGVKVSKSAKVKIEQVESFAEVTTVENTAFVALNYLPTVCLILTADKACEIEVLTVK